MSAAPASPREKAYLGVILILGCISIASVIWAFHNKRELQALRLRIERSAQIDRGPLVRRVVPTKRGVRPPPRPLIVPRPKGLVAVPHHLFKGHSRYVTLVFEGSRKAVGAYRRRRNVYMPVGYLKGVARWPARFRDSVRFIRINNAAISTRELALLKHFSRLSYVTLSRSSITRSFVPITFAARSIQLLQINDPLLWMCDLKLHNLTRLSILGNTDLAKPGMRCIGYLRGLHSLQLYRTGGVDDAALSEIKGMTGLRSLQLSNLNVTGAGLVALKHLSTLRHLTMRYLPHLTDAGLRHLVPLIRLERLTLQSPSLTGAGFRHVASLPYLRVLYLYMPRFNDAGARAIAGFSALRTLTLFSRDITNRGIQKLSALRDLRSLQLNHSTANDAALAAISKLRQLSILHLNRSFVTDRGLRYLTKLRGLRYLSLRETRVSDAGVRYLLRLPRLRHLDLYRTRVSKVGVTRLCGMSSLRRLTSSAGLSHRRKNALRMRYPRLHLYDH